MTETATTWLTGGVCVQHGYPGQRDDLRPAQDGDTARFHKAIQNGARFNAYKFFIVEIFHIIFSDYSWPGLTETMERKTSDKGILLYLIKSLWGLNKQIHIKHLAEYLEYNKHSN